MVSAVRALFPPVKSCWEHCCRRETLGTCSTIQTLCLPIVTSCKPNIGGGKAKNLFNDQMCVVGNRRNKITEKQWGFKKLTLKSRLYIQSKIKTNRYHTCSPLFQKWTKALSLPFFRTSALAELHGISGGL